MMFDGCNIDRAIVITQYDLRGFVHPLGGRTSRVSPKNLCAITWNLPGFAFGSADDDTPPEEKADFLEMNSTYEEYLDMCQQFAAACDLSQREAIQLILKDIHARYNELKREVAAGYDWTREHFDNYLGELSVDSHWGRWLLALEQAFMGPTEDQVREALHMLDASEITALLEAATTPEERRSAVEAALIAHNIENVPDHMHYYGISKHAGLA